MDNEYQIVALFHEVISGVNASMTNFLTVLMAMLVASYLVANKLDRLAAGIVLTLYSVFMLGMLNELYSGYRDFAAIGMEMVRIGQQPGSTIAWHPTVINGGQGLQSLPWIIVGITFSAWLASVWFFVHARRRNLAGTAESSD